MKTAALFVATALVTGLQNLYQLTEMPARITLPSYLPVAGSAGLLVAGALMLGNPRLAVKISLGSALLTWYFYARYIAVSVQMLFRAPQEIVSFSSLSGYIHFAGLVAGPILLLASTITALALLRRSGQFQ